MGFPVVSGARRKQRIERLLPLRIVLGAEVVAVRDPKAEQNPSWRQALSYWEMAASLVLRGALDPDLFLDTNNEGILLYAKFHHFHAETEKESGNRFMAQTAALIDAYPVARARYEGFLKNFGRPTPAV